MTHVVVITQDTKQLIFKEQLTEISAPDYTGCSSSGVMGTPVHIMVTPVHVKEIKI
jgi:hypothetical protein